MSALDTIARFWFCRYQGELMPMGDEDPELYRQEADRLREKLKAMGVDPYAGMPHFKKEKKRRRR